MSAPAVIPFREETLVRRVVVAVSLAVMPLVPIGALAATVVGQLRG